METTTGIQPEQSVASRNRLKPMSLKQMFESERFSVWRSISLPSVHLLSEGSEQLVPPRLPLLASTHDQILSYCPNDETKIRPSHL
jgi:hypothetical protein